jgi:hypothetical protein
VSALVSFSRTLLLTLAHFLILNTLLPKRQPQLSDRQRRSSSSACLQRVRYVPSLSTIHARAERHTRHAPALVPAPITKQLIDASFPTYLPGATPPRTAQRPKANRTCAWHARRASSHPRACSRVRRPKTPRSTRTKTCSFPSPAFMSLRAPTRRASPSSATPSSAGASSSSTDSRCAGPRRASRTRACHSGTRRMSARLPQARYRSLLQFQYPFLNVVLHA